MKASKVAKHLRIYGHVQGVSYRAWSIQTAQQIGLTGWVRNRKDGSVEALAIGDTEGLQRFITACHKGPTLAKVENIDISDADLEELSDFEFRETV